jgi:NAD(P)-dependent dehydrogenase (short-subunit alcohol dehydrogenase family)
MTSPGRAACDALFQRHGVFERAAWEEARALFDPAATIVQHFGAASGKPVTVDGFIQSMNGPAGAMLGNPVYTNRVVLESTTPNVVVEQHTSTLRPLGAGPVSLEVALIVEMSPRGGILRMAEYLDPGPIVREVTKVKATEKATVKATATAKTNLPHAKSPTNAPSSRRLPLNSVAVVTGASSGLGAYFARTLARHGCTVILCARRVERLHALRDELTRAFGCDAHSVAMDVASPASIAASFGEIDALLGPGRAINILVNNAGIARPSRFVDTTLEDYDAIMATNVRGAFLVAQAAARRMVAAAVSDPPSSTAASSTAAPPPFFGRIINVGSILGMRAGQQQTTCKPLSLHSLLSPPAPRPPNPHFTQEFPTSTWSRVCTLQPFLVPSPPILPTPASCLARTYLPTRHTYPSSLSLRFLSLHLAPCALLSLPSLRRRHGQGVGPPHDSHHGARDGSTLHQRQRHRARLLRHGDE